MGAENIGRGSDFFGDDDLWSNGNGYDTEYEFLLKRRFSPDMIQMIMKSDELNQDLQSLMFLQEKKSAIFLEKFIVFRFKVLIKFVRFKFGEIL